MAFGLEIFANQFARAASPEARDLSQRIGAISKHVVDLLGPLNIKEIRDDVGRAFEAHAVKLQDGSARVSKRISRIDVMSYGSHDHLPLTTQESLLAFAAFGKRCKLVLDALEQLKRCKNLCALDRSHVSALVSYLAYNPYDPNGLFHGIAPSFLDQMVQGQLIQIQAGNDFKHIFNFMFDPETMGHQDVLKKINRLINKNSFTHEALSTNLINYYCYHAPLPLGPEADGP